MATNQRDFIKGACTLTGGLLMPAYLTKCQFPGEEQEYDVVVYGGTSAGIIMRMMMFGFMRPGG